MSTNHPTPASGGRRPRVLFVGEPDEALPEIAAGLLRRGLGDRVEVAAAGTHPRGPLAPDSAETLRAVGGDPGAEPTPVLTAAALRRADRVVSLGRTVDVARLAGPRYETWDTAEITTPVSDIPHPADGLAPAAQALLQRVDALAQDLTTAPTDPVEPTWRGRFRVFLARLRRF